MSMFSNAGRRIFFWGILLSSLVLSPAILDFTLNPRFIGFSALILCLFLAYRKHAGGVRLDLLTLVYSAFALFCIFSSGWAINFSESANLAGKELLACLFFIACIPVLHAWEEGPLCIRRAAIICSLVLFCVFVFQLAGVPDFSKASMYEITGLNGHKNLFSSFVFLLTAMLLLLRRPDATGEQVAYFIAMAGNLVIVLMLRTKAVWMGAAIATVTFLVYRMASQRLAKRNYLIAATVAVIVTLNLFFTLVLPKLIDKTLSLSKAGEAKQGMLLFTDEERLTLWQKTYELISKKPVVGHGAGNWQVVFPDATLSGLWRAEDLNFTFQRPHNDFLWILSETGYVGFNVWLLFVVLMFALLYKTAAEDKTMRRDAALVAAGIAGYLTAGFFDFPKERIEHVLWLTLLLATGRKMVVTKNRLPGITVGSATLKITGSLLAAAILVIAINRYSGELHTRKLYALKAAGDNAAVLSTAERAENTFYTLDPTSLPLHWYAGNAAAALQQYPMALEHLKRAFAMNPFNRNVINDLASAEVFAGDTARAITLYLEASRISPRYDDPKLNLAAIYIGQNKLIEAKACLDSLKHDSPRRTSYENLVRIRLGK